MANENPLCMDHRPSKLLDEPHCLWALCQHLCCWETVQRMARGNLRYANIRTSTRTQVSREDELPALNVVNVSEWSELDMVPAGKVTQKRFISEKVSTKIQHPCTSLDSAILQPVPCGLANVHFPKLVSSPPAVRPASSKDSKTIKLSQAYIQPLEPCPAPVMIWVPSSQHITHKPLQWSSCVGHLAKSPHVTVMQISCSFPPRFADPMDWMKSKTGAKRVHFQAPGKPEAGDGPSTDGELDSDEAVDARGGDMLLEKKPEVLRNLRQRRQRGASSRDVLAPDYMPDTKVQTGGALWTRL
ncbi:uncharacterized protein [Paramormyrops kingsleyae]|uniref:uncharacterized protein n=1 Tax=Paramormyrops kingsleyae TaxID=1676925 RepID=UPI003B96EB91